MLSYGFLMTALIVSIAAWGAILWSMAQSVYSASVVRGDFGQVTGEKLPAEEERAERKRLNAIYENEVLYDRAA